MRRLAAVLACALMLLTGCEPEHGGRPAKPPAAGAQQPGLANPPPGANEPGPQADPGTCVNRPGKRSISLEASWTSETKVPPVITWALNGVVTPATNVPEGHRNLSSQLYGGEWSTLVQAQCGDTVSISIAGTRSGVGAHCIISDLGRGPFKTGERNCEAHYVVP